MWRRGWGAWLEMNVERRVSIWWIIGCRFGDEAWVRMRMRSSEGRRGKRGKVVSEAEAECCAVGWGSESVDAMERRLLDSSS